MLDCCEFKPMQGLVKLNSFIFYVFFYKGLHAFSDQTAQYWVIVLCSISDDDKLLSAKTANQRDTLIVIAPMLYDWYAETNKTDIQAENSLPPSPPWAPKVWGISIDAILSSEMTCPFQTLFITKSWREGMAFSEEEGGGACQVWWSNYHFYKSLDVENFHCHREVVV